MPKSKLIVIVGPTASGKSEFAVKLAKRINGEIISADSRQIYRGLDIGTGKICGRWRSMRRSSTSAGNRTSKTFVYKAIPHYCIDFVPPKKIYTVAEYKKCAQAAITDITGRGKIPILAGGTAFWIDAVVYDLKIPEVPPNIRLRGKLEKKSIAELLKILRKLDPRRAKTIEQKNPRRIIRAIEIAETLGGVPKLSKKQSPYRLLWIGLRPPREELKKRIHRRTLQWLQRGLIGEGRRLRKTGLSWKKFYEFGFDYRPLADFLRKKINKRKLIINMDLGLEQYARRQMRWWKRNPRIHWISSPVHLNDTNMRRTFARFLAS